MAGRWVMALIQTTFAVMPAARLLVRRVELRARRRRDLDRHAGRVHDAADAPVLPVGQLLSVGVDVQTSLALFDRVFEYLDLPVDMVEKPDAVELGECRGRRRLRQRLVPLLARGAVDARGRVRRPFRPGTTLAIVGETGAGKTTMGYLVARLYDVERGRVTIDGEDVRDVIFASLARHGRRRLAGDVPLPRHRSRESPLRAAGRDRRGDRGGGARRADPRPDRLARRRLRHRRRASAATVLGRGEAADRDRADDPPQPAGADPRRGDERARHADGARSAGRARPARGGPDDDRDRPPSLDGSRRRPDRRPRRAAGSSSAARTRSCSSSAAATPALVSRDADLVPLP